MKGVKKDEILVKQLPWRGMKGDVETTTNPWCKQQHTAANVKPTEEKLYKRYVLDVTKGDVFGNARTNVPIMTK